VVGAAGAAVTGVGVAGDAVAGAVGAKNSTEPWKT